MKIEIDNGKLFLNLDTWDKLQVAQTSDIVVNLKTQLTSGTFDQHQKFNDNLVEVLPGDSPNLYPNGLRVGTAIPYYMYKANLYHLNEKATFVYFYWNHNVDVLKLKLFGHESYACLVFECPKEQGKTAQEWKSLIENEMKLQ